MLRVVLANIEASVKLNLIGKNFYSTCFLKQGSNFRPPDVLADFQPVVDSKCLVTQTPDAPSKFEGTRIIDLESELDITQQKLSKEFEMNFYLLDYGVKKKFSPHSF